MLDPSTAVCLLPKTMEKLEKYRTGSEDLVKFVIISRFSLDFMLDKKWMDIDAGIRG